MSRQRAGPRPGDLSATARSWTGSWPGCPPGRRSHSDRRAAGAGPVGDPRADLRRGLLTAAELDQSPGCSGAARRPRGARAGLGAGIPAAAAGRAGRGPAVSQPGPAAGGLARPAGGRAAQPGPGAYLVAALTQSAARRVGRPWEHTLPCSGRSGCRGDLLDRLTDACAASRPGWCSPTGRSRPGPGAARPRERGGRVHAPGQRRRRQGGQRADRHRAPFGASASSPKRSGMSVTVPRATPTRAR